MDIARPQSQFLINEKMTMPADAVAITGGSISVCSLTARRNSGAPSGLIGSFHPSMRQNATVFGARSTSWMRKSQSGGENAASVSALANRKPLPI